jgi:hypothetical protein
MREARLLLAANERRANLPLFRDNTFRVGVDVAHATLEQALERLDRWHADKSPDVRLRFDLGELLLLLAPLEVDRVPLLRRSRDVLRAALAEHPDHPVAPDAWLTLAFSCGHLGDHACERDSYLHILASRTADAERATPLLNLAETEMHLGHLQEAIDGYRETIRVAARIPGDATTPALATWGLAVALDRSGDHAGGEAQARKALEREQSVARVVPLLHSSGVFFVPPYEVEWYDGLGAVALARVMKQPADQVTEWTLAEKHFSAYVREAERAKNDPFLEIAKARLAAIAKEKAAAEKRKAKAPPKPKLRAEDEDPDAQLGGAGAPGPSGGSSPGTVFIP